MDTKLARTSFPVVAAQNFRKSSALVHLTQPIEPEQIRKSVAEEFLWWCQSNTNQSPKHRLTKVGYAGAFPVTIIGKIFAGIFAIAAVGVVAIPTGILAASFGHSFRLETNRRRGVEAKLIVSAAKNEVAAPDESLIALLSQAHRWRDQLAAGEVSSARQIARDGGISPSEVSRIIRLAFLAPDIVKAVLDGRQPIELTPRRLMRIGELPLEWRSQHRLLSFPA